MRSMAGTRGVKSVEGRNKHADPKRGMSSMGSKGRSAPVMKRDNPMVAKTLPTRGTKRRM